LNSFSWSTISKWTLYNIDSSNPYGINKVGGKRPLLFSSRGEERLEYSTFFLLLTFRITLTHLGTFASLLKFLFVRLIVYPEFKGAI